MNRIEISTIRWQHTNWDHVRTTRMVTNLGIQFVPRLPTLAIQSIPQSQNSDTALPTFVLFQQVRQHDHRRYRRLRLLLYLPCRCLRLAEKEEKEKGMQPYGKKEKYIMDNNVRNSKRVIKNNGNYIVLYGERRRRKTRSPNIYDIWRKKETHPLQLQVKDIFHIMQFTSISTSFRVQIFACFRVVL